MFKNSIELPQIFDAKNVIIYLILINIIAFIAMFIDKKKAEKNKWRISEKFLFTLVILGGGIGGILGMYIFRHKTKKPAFVIGFPAILILEIVTVIVFTVF